MKESDTQISLFHNPLSLSASSNKSLFGLGSAPAEVEIVFAGESQRKLVEVKKTKFPLYFDGESIAGKVHGI